MLPRGALSSTAMVCVAAVALASCGASGPPSKSHTATASSTAARNGSGTASGPAASSDPKRGSAAAKPGARALPLPPSTPASQLDRREVSGKVGKADALPAAATASSGGYVAPGAPSDAQIKAEIAQARKAGIILPQGNTAQSFEQGATYVGGGGGGSWVFPIQPHA